MPNLVLIVWLSITILINLNSELGYKKPILRGNNMNQKCFLCGSAGTKIIERPNGYDGDHVNCPECTNYKIVRTVVPKLLHGYQVRTSLSDKVKSHFEKTGERYEVNTVTLSLL